MDEKLNNESTVDHSCINCKYYYFSAPQHDQPYPEFACMKEHWDGLSCTEDYDKLFDKTDCKDFMLL